MQLHLPKRNYVHAAHIVKLDHTLRVLIHKVRHCSFRLHTLLFPFPMHLGPLDLYLDSHLSIANTHGSPLHYRNREFVIVQRTFGLFAAVHTLSLRMLFHTLSGLEILTSFWVIRCGSLLLQWLFPCKTSYQLVYRRNAAGF